MNRLIITTVLLFSSSLFAWGFNHCPETDKCNASLNDWEELSNNAALADAIMNNGCSGMYESDKIKFVRVNFHYIQSEGDNDPGNFTATSDGMGNTNYTGYDLAEAIIQDANDGWSKNYEMTLYATPTAPEVKPKGIQLLLKGVYFHKDPLYGEYSHPSGACGSAMDYIGRFGEDVGSAINIFMVEDVNLRNIDGSRKCTNRGVACPVANKASVVIENTWCRYASGLDIYSIARTLNHEIGHVLGLDHSFECAPQCSDIDADAEYNAYETDPTTGMRTLLPCGQGDSHVWTSGSNNVMGYNPANNTLAPCQIDIIHGRLDSDLNGYVEECAAHCGTEVVSYQADGRTITGIQTKACCHPATAFFNLPEVLYACNGGMTLPDIILDAAGSWKEERHRIQILKKVPPPGYNRWFDSQSIQGEAGRIDLRALTASKPDFFEAGFEYWIKLIVTSDCTNWTSMEQDFTIEATDLACGELCEPELTFQIDDCVYSDYSNELVGSLSMILEEETGCTLNNIESICWSLNDDDVVEFNTLSTEKCDIDLRQVDLYSDGDEGAFRLKVIITYISSDGQRKTWAYFKTHEVRDCCKPTIENIIPLCANPLSPSSQQGRFKLVFPDDPMCREIEIRSIVWRVNEEMACFSNGLDRISGKEFEEVDVFLKGKTGLLALDYIIRYKIVGGSLGIWRDKILVQIDTCTTCPVIIPPVPPIELAYICTKDFGSTCYNFTDPCLASLALSSNDPKLQVYTTTGTNICLQSIWPQPRVSTINITPTDIYGMPSPQVTWTIYIDQDDQCELEGGPRAAVAEDPQGNVATADQLLVYPNPFQNELNIQLPKSVTGQQVRYVIRDLTQRKLQEHWIFSDQTKINLRDINQGVYLISFWNEKAGLIGTKRIVKLISN